MTQSLDYILRNFGSLEETNLNYVLEGRAEADENISVFKNSKYYSHDAFVDLVMNQKNCFIILSLNVQTINAKVDKRLILLRELYEQDFEFLPFVSKKHGSTHKQICHFFSWRIIIVFHKKDNVVHMGVL